MKKVLVLSLALAITSSVFLTSQVEARRKKNKDERVERTAEEPYRGATLTFGSPPDVGGACIRNPMPNEPGMGCVYFEIDPAVDLFASIMVNDDSARPVHAYIWDDQQSVFADICGETDEILALEPAAEIAIWMSAQPCSDGTPSVPTTGMVEVTFSNLP